LLHCLNKTLADEKKYILKYGEEHERLDIYTIHIPSHSNQSIDRIHWIGTPQSNSRCPKHTANP